MSEADGKVKIEYEVTGVEEASTAQQELEASLRDVQQVLDGSNARLAEYEQAQTDAADASDSLTAAAVEQGFKMGELRERVGSAVGALGTLSSMLGTDSDTGALLGRMSHFGQLGMQVGGTFGPQGAVVGGILGALIPALDELVVTTSEAAEELDAARAAADNMALSMANAANSARTLARAQLEARSQAALATDEVGVRLATEDALLTARDAARQRALDGQRELASIQRNNDARDLVGEIEPRQRRIDEALRELQITSGELERRAAAAREESNAPASATTPAARSGGRGGARREGPAFDEAMYLSEFRVGLMDEEESRELARIQRVAEAERRMLDERKAHDEENARALDEFQRESLANRVREEAEALELQESKRLAIKRRQEADTRMWRTTQESMLDATLGGANAIGGAFANAFGAAIQGQEDFGTAFVKGMKMQLIQFGVGQVAEGAGALLSAVGLAFTNPPAAAGKAVEGAGKIALGVSLGAAGAAISTPAAPSAEDKAPRMGPAANEGASGGNVIVNMNSPFVTAGTRAELGRGLTRSIADSSRRFGRAA
jgi:hypothetical protein